MMHLLYNLLFYLATPILFARQYYKIRKSRQYQLFPQQGRWKERLGIVPASAKSDQRPIWIHTVSVGEFMAALPLIETLLKQHPSIPLLVTTTTLTGSDQVKRLLADRVLHLYLPWDLPFAVKAFYRQIQPRLGLVMETEIWPNFVSYAQSYSIPLVLINGRMSAKSAKGYAKFAGLTQKMMSGLSAICAQTDEDKERFIGLGASPGSVSTTGSIKFDLKVNEAFKPVAEKLTKQLAWNEKQVMVAASTHQTEDELILEVFRGLQKKHQHLSLIIVPRHPERFEQVFQLCQNQGFSVVKRSKIDALAPTPSDVKKVEILLGDSMGEMMLYFYMGNLVIMGGTFVPNGGHNILEPAVLGLPLFYGPSMFNFKKINQLFLQQQAAVQVADKNQLEKHLDRLISNPQELEILGKNAKGIMNKNSGALDKMYRLILEKGRLN